jgi:hypothetical protein
LYYRAEVKIAKLRLVGNVDEQLTVMSRLAYVFVQVAIVCSGYNNIGGIQVCIGK